MKRKRPTSKAIINIVKIPKGLRPPSKQKEVPCTTLITPDSLFQRDRLMTNHELWLRLHAGSVQRLLEEKDHHEQTPETQA